MVARNKYSKGANAERELLHVLWKQGFAVIRAAGSGTVPLPSPDLVATNGHRTIAFECKAWDAKYLHLSHSQMHELMEWSQLAQAKLIVGWKIPNKGWLFLKPEHFKKNEKNYSITRKTAEKKNTLLNVILGKQARLKL